MLNVARGEPLALPHRLRGPADDDTVHDHIRTDCQIFCRELMFGGYVRDERVVIARERNLLSLIQVRQCN